MERRTKNRNPLQVYQEQPTRSNAIKAKCFSCVGSGEDPYIQAIRGCTVKSCPLFPFRPYR